MTVTSFVRPVQDLWKCSRNKAAVFPLEEPISTTERDGAGQGRERAGQGKGQGRERAGQERAGQGKGRERAGQGRERAGQGRSVQSVTSC